MPKQPKSQSTNARSAGNAFLQDIGIYDQRLRLLLDDYGIEKSDPNRWYFLGLNLALQYVPGFKIGDPQAPRRRGRTPSKDWFDLVAEIDITATEEGVSIGMACDLLCKRNKAPWKGHSARTLQAGYYARRKRIRSDRFLKHLYEEWNMFRLQRVPENNGNSEADEEARRWNSLSKLELGSELRKKVSFDRFVFGIFGTPVFVFGEGFKMPGHRVVFDAPAKMTKKIP